MKTRRNALRVPMGVLLLMAAPGAFELVACDGTESAQSSSSTTATGSGGSAAGGGDSAGGAGGGGGGDVVIQCDSGKTLCDGACVDIGTDLANCGACGQPCSAGMSCTSAICVGPSCNGFRLGGPSALDTPSSGMPKVADLNADGAADIIFPVDDKLRVLLSKGDGGFSAVITFSLGGMTIQDIAIGDLNNDGLPEIAVVNFVDASVILNEGGGVFSPAVHYPTGAGPRAIAIADMNGDGKRDLAVGDTGNGVCTGTCLSVLSGAGDGTFGAPAVTTVNTMLSVVAMAAGDVNGDAFPDVVFTSSSASDVRVVLNNGDGTFSVAGDYDSTPVGLQSDIELRDLNDDGALDVVVTGIGMSILFNDGVGAFPTRVDHEGVQFQIADLNGDTSPDLVLTDFNQVTKSLLNDGAGSFTTKYEFAFQPSYFGLGDVTSDGNVDFIFFSSLFAAVVPGAGAGAFTTAPAYDAGKEPGPIVSADVDRDGKLDIIVENEGGLGVLRNSGGSLAAPVTYDPGPSAFFDGGLVARDLNADGAPDIAAINFESSEVSVLLNKGDGTFAPRVSYSIAAADKYANPIELAVGDLNGDGKPDLVVLNQSGNGMPTVVAFFNKGGGAFGPGVVLFKGGFIRDMAIGDLDSDGDLDLAVSKYPNGAQVFINSGDGTFTPGSMLSTGPNSGTIVAGHVSNGSVTDLVMADDYESEVSVFRPGLAGQFNDREVYPAGESPSHLTLWDMDGDGELDILGTSGIAGPSYVWVVLNLGFNSFAEPLFYFAPNIDGLTVTDIDGDGRPDLALTNPKDGSVTVLHNTCVQ